MGPVDVVVSGEPRLVRGLRFDLGGAAVDDENDHPDGDRIRAKLSPPGDPAARRPA